MIADRQVQGWRVWGLGLGAIGAVTLAFGDFDVPVPKAFPERTLLAYAAAVFLILAGAAIEWPRITARAAAVLTAYYILVVALLIDGHMILKYPTNYGAYNGLAEPLAIAMGGLIVAASFAQMDAARAARLIRIAQIVFGLCAIFFGIAHFVYMNMTAPLVPAWLPPSQVFWGYATGIFHIAAGVAIIAGIQARLATILLTVMFVCFTFLVHLPLAFAHPADHFIWSENAENLALIGAAWVIADSFRATSDR